jgi:tape measure domain-containing protein
VVVRELITLLGFKLDDSGSKKYDKQIDETKRKQESMFASMFKAQALYNVASSAIGAAFNFVKQSIFEVAGETEKYRASLGAMIGDQEKANQIIHDLDYSPLSDFYGTASAIGGLQGLVTMGVQAEEASDLLLRLGDIAGGSGAALQSLGLNMGQVFAKGKADATDLKQFVTQGFDVVGVVAQQTGKTREQVEKAGVTYRQTADALRVLTSEGGKYYGLMAKNMNTIPGIIAQFKSFIAATQEGIGFGVNQELKDMLRYILEVGRGFQEAFVNNGVNAVKMVLVGIATVIVMVTRFNRQMADVGGAFGNIKDIAGELFGFIVSVIQSAVPLILSIAEVFFRAFGPIKAFIIPVINALRPVFEEVFAYAADLVSGLIPIINGLTPVFSVLGNIVGGAISVFASGGMTVIKALTPIAKVIFAIVVAVKILTAAWGLFNIIASANPIGLIILAVVALIGIIVLLVKNLDKVGQFFTMIGTAIAGFFKRIWDTIIGVFNQIVAFVKKNLVNIINVIVAILFPLAGIIMVLVRLIIKHWDTIKAAFTKAAHAVVAGVKAAWDRLVSIVQGIADRIKAVWQGIVGAVATVIAMISLIVSRIWEGIVSIVTGIIDRVKGVWQGLGDFMGGLWEGIKSVAAAFWDWLGDKATAIWDGIVNAFTGAVDTIRGIWDGFVGFFTGTWDKIKGAFSAVSNFLGFGGPEDVPAPATGKPVKDMILTPEGRFDTDPRDYIMAMKNPETLAGNAARNAAGVSNQYSNSQSAVTINVQSSITTAVPAGTLMEQAAALKKQASEAVRMEWARVIAGARGLIPSPEGRRAL